MTARRPGEKPVRADSSDPLSRAPRERVRERALSSPTPTQPPLSKALRPTEAASDKAASLRRRSTPPERILWQRLRAHRLDGLKFRRQHPIGPSVADFYCPRAGLVVEIDGEAHRDRNKQRDRERDEWMQANGIEVLRIPAWQIRDNLHGVLRTIRDRACERIAAIEHGRKQERA